MTALRKGLRKWALLEPDRCKVNGLPNPHANDDYLVRVSRCWSRPFWHVECEGLGDAWDILAAVIEAIEAHGWEWSLWSDGALAEATVTIPGEERRRFDKSGAGEPVIGLLMAYLEALEAEGAT